MVVRIFLTLFRSGLLSSESIGICYTRVGKCRKRGEQIDFVETEITISLPRLELSRMQGRCSSPSVGVPCSNSGIRKSDAICVLLGHFACRVGVHWIGSGRVKSPHPTSKGHLNRIGRRLLLRTRCSRGGKTCFSTKRNPSE